MPWRRIWALAAVIAKLTTWALAPPEGCPDVVWTEFCAGTTTCETLALAGLTCGGITVIPGCDAICGSPCCISTTTTTIVTHTVTHSVTTATVTSVTATTSYTSVTGTAPSTRTITMVNPVTTVTSVKTVPLCDLGCRIDSIGNVNPWRGVYRLSPQPPPRDGHTMVLDVQQRMWVFGGYEPVGPPRGRMNDLHYFDIQARKWNKVNVRNAPSKRYGHTAVLDTQQRMWIFGAGSFWNSGWLNDLHYFDTKARQWHEVTAKNAADAPVGREGATAVLYGLEMWIFAGYNGWKGGWLNDLHYFDIQAEMWHEAIVSNAPSERYSHSAVLDVEQGMWIFGGKGRDDSDSQWVNDLHYFNLKAFNKAKSAHLWHKVTTNTAPSERYGHTAVLDDQQRMWIFGGHTQSGRINDLHYLDIKALVWHEVSAGNPPSARESHKAVLDAERRMLIFGGKVADGVRGERLNDLLYFDTKVERAITTTTSTASTSTSTKTTETTETTTTTTTTRTTTTTTTAAAVVPMDPTSTPTPSPTMSVTSTTPSAACKLFTCPRGYVRKNVSQIADRSSRTYLYQECCEPSCQLFRCPKGHTQTSWSHEIAGSQIACCKEITTAAPTVTCEHFPCPRGYIHKNLSQTGVAGRSYQTCCDRSCLLLKCPPGHEKIKGAEDLPGSTETCCRLQASSAPVSSSESTSTSGSIDAAESFVDEQLPESDVDLPAKNTSHQDQELEQPEAEAHYVPILAVGLPVLLACLLITICLLCRRLRKLRGAEAEAELPETSNPLSLLRPFRSTAKPMLFAWDARMTAEWPRGKVLEVIVEEGVFYANGRSYTFRAAGPSRHFAWEDGTIQRLERIERNVAWWSTQHEHLAWREFRWICAPQCHVEDHDGHDMELTDLTGFDGYRCMLCSRPQAADQHWHCPLHDVHLCPNCAEVPPKTPTLGVAATYLVNIFPTLASRAAAKEDPNFHEICPRLAHGPSGMGFDKMCPRDGRPHCSIVDALEDAYSGQTTHFVSWCWNYSLQDVVSAVERWLQKSGEDQRYVFLWMCFFCNNQYRIKEEACQTGSEDLKCIFESHLVEAGRMLVLLDTIIRPTYVMRAWCIFESYVCIARDIPMSIILPATAEAFFRDTVTDRGIRVLMEAVEALNVRDAKASSTVDEDLIKQIILNTTGFDVVNNAVRTRLVDQLAALFRELLLPQPR